MAVPYGTVNPRGFEPFQIETPLAQAAAKGEPGAIQLLGGYQALSGAASSQYADEIAQQHELARQSLLAEIAKNQVSGIASLADKPGGAALISQLPQLAGGLDTGTLQGINDLSIRGALAKVLQEAGAGAYSSAEAGVPVSAQQVSGITGLQHATGVPIPIQVANINAAGRVAAANAGLDRITVSGEGGQLDAYGNPIKWSMPVKQGNWDLAGQRIRQAGGTVVPGGGTATNLPMAQIDQGGGSPNTSAAPSTAATGGNRIEQRGAGGNQGSPLDPRTPAGAQMQRAAQQKLAQMEQSQNKATRDAAADVRSAMNGTVIQLKQLPDGTIGVAGTRGVYR